MLSALVTVVMQVTFEVCLLHAEALGVYSAAYSTVRKQAKICLVAVDSLGVSVANNTMRYICLNARQQNSTSTVAALTREHL